MPARPGTRRPVALPRRLPEVREAALGRRVAVRQLRPVGQARPRRSLRARTVEALLDEAEDIVNMAAPDVLSDFEKKNRKRRIFRRKKKKKK